MAGSCSSRRVLQRAHAGVAHGVSSAAARHAAHQPQQRLLALGEAVADAAVVGWPSKEFDEEVAAFVILNKSIDAEELKLVCKAKLAPYKVPRQIFLVEELPRNSLGKVLKPELVKRLQPL